MLLQKDDLRLIQSALFNYSNAAHANKQDILKREGKCQASEFWMDMGVRSNNLAVSIERWMLNGSERERELIFRLEDGPVEVVVKQLGDSLELLMEKAAMGVAAHLTVEELARCQGPDHSRLLAAYNLGRYDASAEAADDLTELPF